MGRQRLVFKSLELGRDEALSVFQGLAPPVVVGHLAGLALRDFNVETVHTVELHAQVGNAGAGSFAGFQVQQKGVTVGLYAAQLVQVSVTAVVDDAAVAHQRRRLVQKVAHQQGRAGRRGLQVFKNLLQQLRRPRLCGHRRLRVGPQAELLCFVQGVAQRNEFAGAHLAQGDARGDPLDVAAALKARAQRLLQAGAQSADGFEPGHRLAALAARRQQPVFEQAAAHACGAGVQQRKEGW